MPVASSSYSNDFGKYIADELIARSELLHRLPQMCHPVPLESGMGKTANFSKFNRTDVPLAPMSEGVTPTETGTTMSTQSITVDQWGLYVAITDVLEVTPKHKVVQENIKLLADAIARTQDYGISAVLDQGTNVQYWDGTRASRVAITSTDVFSKNVFNKVRTNLNDAGAPPKDGDFFTVVCGPQLESDILADATAVGSFTAAHQLQGTDKLEKGTVGAWLGMKIIRTNFIPKYTRLAAIAMTAGTAGTLATATYFYKWTRKNTQRGFEEDIAIEASVAVTGATGSYSATTPATAGFVYNLYVGTATGDANLFLYASNILPNTAVVVTAMVGSGTNPPATPNTGFTTHVMYVFADESVDWVELGDMSAMGLITPKGASDSDPLYQRRKMGSKYMAKSGIRDNTRTVRIELASNF